MVNRIIIIGGGFAAVNVAKYLNSKEYHITLVDKNNYAFFLRLLYQLPTGFLETSSIGYPYRKMFRSKSNFRSNQERQYK